MGNSLFQPMAGQDYIDPYSCDCGTIFDLEKRVTCPNCTKRADADPRPEDGIGDLLGPPRVDVGGQPAGHRRDDRGDIGAMLDQTGPSTGEPNEDVAALMEEHPHVGALTITGVLWISAVIMAAANGGLIWTAVAIVFGLAFAAIVVHAAHHYGLVGAGENDVQEAEDP